MRSFIHTLNVVLGRELPETQTTPAEREALCRHLPGRKTIVEIGVFEGFTTRLLAERSDADAIVFGVDPFFAGHVGICWGKVAASHYSRRHLKSGKVRLVPRLSTEVGDSVPETVDFVFVDGDHSLGGITSDWAFWTPRLAAGGIIALHDAVREPGKQQSFGSHEYYESHVKQDGRFRVAEEVQSLAVLEKVENAIPA